MSERSPVEPSLWLQAQGAMAADLATFQAGHPTARSHALTDVLAAMAPAYKLGFAWSLKGTKEEFTLMLLHRSGWDLSTTVLLEPGTDTVGVALADLLGIRVESVAAAAQPEPAQQGSEGSASAVATDESVVIAQEEPNDEPNFADDDIDEAAADDLGKPMKPADISTCLALIKALAADERKAFTIAFRSHFQVPREARTISSFITHGAHQQFIQTFLDELELQGEAP